MVVIDEDEREHAQDNSRHQTRPSKASRESRRGPPDVSERVVDGKAADVSYDCQTGARGGQRNSERSSSLSIPPLQELKEEVQSSVTKSSPLKLGRPQDAKRSSNKEREDARTAAPVYVSAGETTDSTGMSIYCVSLKGKCLGADLIEFWNSALPVQVNIKASIACILTLLQGTL